MTNTLLRVSVAHQRDIETFSRRKLLQAGGATAIAASLPAWGQGAPTPLRPVRAATGLLAMWQSTAWLGAEAGLFKKRGIDMTLPAVAVGGPEAAAGLIRGDWEFAHNRHRTHRRRSSERSERRDIGDADGGILELLYHDRKGDH